jgi:hypothetical protein
MTYGGVDTFRFEAVLRAHDGRRVAVDAGYRTYTGVLRYYGATIEVEQDDESTAWLRTDAVHGLRTFATEKVSRD